MKQVRTSAEKKEYFKRLHYSRIAKRCFKKIEKKNKKEAIIKQARENYLKAVKLVELEQDVPNKVKNIFAKFNETDQCVSETLGKQH